MPSRNRLFLLSGIALLTSVFCQLDAHGAKRNVAGFWSKGVEVFAQILDPWPFMAGLERRAPTVVRAATGIRTLASADAIRQIGLIEMAGSYAVQWTPNAKVFSDSVMVPTVAQMEEAARLNRWSSLRSDCTGQAVFMASLAENLGFVWRYEHNHTHVWLQVFHAGVWLNLNSPDGFKGPRAPHPDLAGADRVALQQIGVLDDRGMLNLWSVDPTVQASRTVVRPMSMGLYWLTTGVAVAFFAWWFFIVCIVQNPMFAAWAGGASFIRARAGLISGHDRTQTRRPRRLLGLVPAFHRLFHR